MKKWSPVAIPDFTTLGYSPLYKPKIFMFNLTIKTKKKLLCKSNLHSPLEQLSFGNNPIILCKRNALQRWCDFAGIFGFEDVSWPNQVDKQHSIM